MIMSVLQTIYSSPFWFGAVAGIILWNVYSRAKVRYADRHDPENGPHYPSSISKVWIAGLAAVLSIGYVLLTAQNTQDQTIRLTKQVAKCWQESYQATRAQIRINTENDVISREQQALQRLFDRASSDWLKQLVSPPGDLANQDTNSPARKAWGLQVTAEYQDKLNDLGAQSDELVNRRTQLDVERKQHPLPETTCGK